MDEPIGIQTTYLPMQNNEICLYSYEEYLEILVYTSPPCIKKSAPFC